MATIQGIHVSQVMPEMRLRTHQWLDFSTMKPQWSIQARAKPRAWAHVYSDDGVIFHNTEADANAALTAMSATPPAAGK